MSPKAAVTAPPGSRVHEKTITTTEKPPITITDQIGVVDDADGSLFTPWTKDFWPYIESLTAADWKDHVARFYRYPLNEKKPRELGRYLVRFDVDNPLLNEKQLSDAYGGGQYDVMLQRKRKLIITDHFEIEGVSKNPDAAAIAAGAAAVPGGGELASTLNTVLQHLKGMQATAPADQTPKFQETISMIQALSNTMPKNEGITGLVTALKALDDLRGGSRDKKSELKETIELLRDLGIIRAEPAAPAKSMAEQLKDVLEVADMMRGGGGGKRDWVTSLIDAAPTIIEKAGGVLDKAVSVSQNNARVAAARAAAAGQPIPAAPGATQTQTAAASLPAPARDVAPLEKEPVAAAPGAESDQPIVIQPPTFEWVKARTVQLFAEGKTGDMVAEFLDTIDPQLGNQLGSLSREQLTRFIESDPILGEISRAPRYHDFVSEFLDFFTSEPASTVDARTD